MPRATCEIRAFGGLALAQAEALHALCFPASWDRPWSRQAFAEILAMPGTFGLMAHAGESDAAMGLAVVRVAADEAEILTIGVHPQQRRHGLASALITAAKTEARGRGASRLHLEVAEDNFTARKLYASLGFEQSGRRAGYYARDSLGNVAALLMAAAL